MKKCEYQIKQVNLLVVKNKYNNYQILILSELI